MENIYNKLDAKGGIIGGIVLSPEIEEEAEGIAECQKLTGWLFWEKRREPTHIEEAAQAADSAKLEGKTLLEISSEIKSAIIDGAPAIHDTLKEISDALNDDDTAINSLLTQLSTLST